MRTTVCALAVTVTLAVAFNTPVLQAQVSETDQLQQLRADIQADRQAVVAANLGLTEAEGEAFWPLYREYRAEMAKKVGDPMQKLIQEYATIYDSATDEQAKAMVDQMMAIGHDELKLKESYLGKFRKVLPEVKVARFFQIENKVDTLIRLELADSIPLISPAK